MKPPYEAVKGRIVDYDPYRQEITIKASYADYPTLVKRQYKDCIINLVDGRPITDKQRCTCYALLKDISDYTGQGLTSTKQAMKRKFMREELGLTNGETFSLSDAPISLTCAFQRYLVQFMLDFEIPCSFSLLDYVDDVQDFMYSCLVSKKCCICGKRADLHHAEHVGTGRDRENIVHEGMLVQPLCRLHHEEAHKIGQYTFNKKYHLCAGIRLDKNLCRLYGLKTKAEELIGD